MNCDEVQQILLDADLLGKLALDKDPITLRDGEALDNGETETIEALDHLRRCLQCADAVRGFAKLARTLRVPNLKEVAPVGGWEAVHARLPETDEPNGSIGSRWWLWVTFSRAFGPAGAIVAILLLCLMGFDGWRLWVSRSGEAIEPFRWGSQQPLVPGAFPSNKPAETDSSLNRVIAAKDAQTFSELSWKHDRRASWLLLGSKSSDAIFDLADAPIPGVSQVLVLRLSASQAGRVVCDRDLVIVPGRTATFSVSTDTERTLRYGVGTSATDLALVSLWCALDESKPSHSSIESDSTAPASLRPVATTTPSAAFSVDVPLVSDRGVLAGELSTSHGVYQVKISHAIVSVSLPPGPAKGD